MSTNKATWIRSGSLALLVYGLLTLWGTFRHQPDPNTQFEAYARFISSAGYLANHLGASIFGSVLAILGVVALAAFLAGGRAERTAIAGMVSSVVGHALILSVFGFSTFASPAVGRAYLAGYQEAAVAINQDILGLPLMVTAIAGGLFYTVGAILLGVAIWRSSRLPRWAGALYAPTGLLIAIVGLMIGQAQTVGSALIIVASGWILWSVSRRPAETMPMGVEPLPG